MYYWLRENPSEMKNILFLIVCLLVFAETAIGQVKPSVAGVSRPKHDASLDTIQYCLGVFAMSQLTKNGFTVEDPAMFKKAIEDVLQKRTLMVDVNSVERKLVTYQLKAIDERNRHIEDQLFTQLKNQPGVGMLPSGVYYTVAKMGQGAKAGAKDSVLLNLIGSQPDGTEFINTNKKLQSMQVVPGELIPGLRDILQIMPAGSIWKVFIPASQANGSLASVPMPQGTAVIFDIGILAVYPKNN